MPFLNNEIRPSLRQLKRSLKETKSSTTTIQQPRRDSRCHGRVAKRKRKHCQLQNNVAEIRFEHELTVSKEFVWNGLRIMDPEGVERLSRHRLQRRLYHAKGPNFILHLDGYDKLKPYGFCIHGCIDGYSRQIIWLEVGRTKNHPGIVASYRLQ